MAVRGVFCSNNGDVLAAAAVAGLGIDPDDMVTVGVNCSLQQLLEHGFFHADPHPGNLLALADGRLAYLDFGMMSEVSRESRTGLIQAVVHLDLFDRFLIFRNVTVYARLSDVDQRASGGSRILSWQQGLRANF